MIDRGNLQEVSQLYDEYNTLTDALASLNSGGHIGSMTIVGGIAQPATVSTDDITPPSQMLDAIKGILTARQGVVRSELTNFGVNMDAPPGQFAQQNLAPPPTPPTRTRRGR